MQSCSSMFDTSSHKVFRDMMTKKCMQSHVSFLSEADEMQYVYCTLENDVVHVHCKRSFVVARDFDIKIFF